MRHFFTKLTENQTTIMDLKIIAQPVEKKVWAKLELTMISRGNLGSKHITSVHEGGGWALTPGHANYVRHPTPNQGTTAPVSVYHQLMS